MLGVRSPHHVMLYGVPSESVHFTAPVAAFRPYTFAFSVATISVEPTTIGWAYTCPLTAVENTFLNVPPATLEGLRLGSWGSQPVRSLSSEVVMSSARAIATRPSGGRATRIAIKARARPASAIGQHARRSRGTRLSSDTGLTTRRALTLRHAAP